MSNLLKKVREKGLKDSVRMVSVKIKKTEKFDKQNLSSNRNVAFQKIVGHDYKSVIIFENHFGYYNIMLQRPQHITRELSDEDTLVIYNSYYDVDYRNYERITEIKPHCYVMDLFYYREALLRFLRTKHIKKTLMVYSTDTVPLHRIQQYEKEEFRILYEYVDDINPDLISPKKLDMVLNRHSYLLNSEYTEIVATASRLYQNILNQNEKANVELISNGVECKKFPREMKTSDEEYLSWLRADKIKMGYYGALANWVDYDLLKKLVDDEAFQLILIGVEHDSSLRDSGILQRNNVMYFGKKPYDQLAGYVHYFDICIIPFVINDITKATSPVKLFEYMAMGKPVITTPMPECMKYDTVEIASNVEEFREKVYRAVKKSKSEQYINALVECAYQNDWKEKANEIKHKFSI